jgi:hypothetical protein
VGADGQVDPNNIYWALKEGKDLASALEDKERAWYESARNRGQLTVWIIAYAAYYGMDPESLNVMASKQLGFDGDEAEFIRFHINEVRAVIRRQNTMALGEPPAFQCLTTNSDHRSQAQNKLSDTIFQSFYRRYAGTKEWEIAEGDGVLGMCGAHLRWDRDGGDKVSVKQQVKGPDGKPSEAMVKRKSGAPRVSVTHVWNTVKEPLDMGDDAAWVEIRERDSKWSLAAKFPEMRQQILDEKTDDQYDFSSLFNLSAVDVANADACIVKYFYHPDCAAVPGGRFAIVYGSLVLWDKSCPVEEGVPFYEMCSGKVIETNFPFADSWELLALQQALNQLNSDEFGNYATFGRQSVAMEKGTEITVDAIATGGKAFFYPAGGKPPTAVLMTAAPPTIGTAKEYLHKRIEYSSAVNATSNGDPPPNVRSGEMAALLHSLTIEYQSYRRLALNRMRVGLANGILDMVRKNGETQFLVEVVGIEDRPYVAEFFAEDLSTIKRVRIEEISSYQQTTAGKIEIYKMLAMVPPEERPAAYEMITTGQSASFLKKDRSCDLRVRRENEDLLKGDRIVEVTSGDHPVKHIQGHYAELEMLLASDKPDMQAANRIGMHISEHLQNWYGMDILLCGALNIPPPPPIPPDPATGRPANPAFMFAIWQSQTPGGGALGAPAPAGQAPGGPPAQQQSPGAGGSPGSSSPGAPAQPKPSGQAASRASQGGLARDPSGTKLPQPSAPPGA